MPALPPAPGVIKFTLKWAIGTDLHAINIHHFRYTGGPPSNGDMNGLCGNTQANAQSAFQTLCDTSVVLEEVDGLDLTTPSSASGNHAAPWTGTRSGAILPASVCAQVRFTIARRYRGGKPKTFAPFGVDGDLASTQSWGSAFVTAVGAGFQTYFTDQALNVAGTTQLVGPVNVGYYKGFTVVTNPSTGRARNKPTLLSSPNIDTITSAICSAVPGSQRRRLRS